ncbi:hypothetical protein C8Q80DRAFT_679514 [Daedaleopsis nitida]|nr:hypothetical protein C8Q80DRAFT_679514 [Daedaleopsis nitida]
MTEGLVPEEDITEIDIRFDDMTFEISALRSTTSPIPVDVVEDDGYSDDVATSSAHNVLSGNCGTISGAAEASRSIYEHHRGPETLRERRMSYLRAMHAMSKSNRQEPNLPPAVLATSVSASASVADRPEWTIEAGILGSRRGNKPRIPEFAARYGGSPIAYLRAQRDTIVAEVRRRRTDRLVGRALHPHVGVASSRVPSDYQEAYARARELDKQHQREINRKREEALRMQEVERQRQEIEECLRTADLDAADLDERSLQDVIEAVIAAAAQTAHLASSR